MFSLPNLIFTIHLIMITFITTVPFLTLSLNLLQIHILCLTSIIVHWLFNNNICVLTETEYLMRRYRGENVSRDDTFMGKIISPWFKIQPIDTTKITILFYLICIINYFNVSCM